MEQNKPFKEIEAVNDFSGVERPQRRLLFFVNLLTFTNSLCICFLVHKFQCKKDPTKEINTLENYIDSGNLLNSLWPCQNWHGQNLKVRCDHLGG